MVGIDLACYAMVPDSGQDISNCLPIKDVDSGDYEQVLSGQIQNRCRVPKESMK